jgi:hypothetical protein
LNAAKLTHFLKLNNLGFEGYQQDLPFLGLSICFLHNFSTILQGFFYYFNIRIIVGYEKHQHNHQGDRLLHT